MTERRDPPRTSGYTAPSMRGRWLGCAALVLLAACGLTVVGTAPPGDGSEVESDAEVRPPRPMRDAEADAEAIRDARAPGDARLDAGPDAPAPVLLRYNIGGPTYVGTGDYPGTWVGDAPDASPCSGNLNATASPIRGTTDDVLFQTERWDNPLACAVGGGKLAPGRYRVRLLFAEIYFGNGCAGGGGNGSRVFDVRLEGNTVAQGLDLHALVGCAANTVGADAGPLERTFEVDVTDGTLDIRMPASSNNAKLAALEISGPL